MIFLNLLMTMNEQRAQSDLHIPFPLILLEFLLHLQSWNQLLWLTLELESSDPLVQDSWIFLFPTIVLFCLGKVDSQDYRTLSIYAEWWWEGAKLLSSFFSST